MANRVCVLCLIVFVWVGVRSVLVCSVVFWSVLVCSGRFLSVVLRLCYEVGGCVGSLQGRPTISLVNYNKENET